MMKKLFFLSVIIAALASCSLNESKTETQETSYKDALNRMNNSTESATIDEIIQTPSYTYFRFKKNGKDQWGAISAREIEVGKTYYYKEAMEMKNFQSKSLDRVFPSIWFINDFSDVSPENMNQKIKKSEDVAQGHHEVKEKPGSISVEKAEGGFSLAEIFEKKSELNGEEILVKGQVVKINENIMKTNWVHIQDGTSYNDLFDITVTTNDAISFKVGEVVTFKGKLILNKDFGYGYKYDYLIENATIQ